MPQGKLKVKTKLPKNVQTKRKGNAVTKRANCPVQSKKKGITEVRKLKQAVNKTVNKAVEEEIRARASNDNSKSLSKAQQAGAEYNKKAVDKPS